MTPHYLHRPLRRTLRAACLAGILLACGSGSILAGTTYVFRTEVTGNPIQPVQCVPGSLTETTPDANLQFQVPAKGCSTIQVTLEGAAGGNGGSGGQGGAGSAVTFTLPAAEYAGTWTALVGQGGAGAGSVTYSGGNGGGYTSVSFNGVLLGIAGGGGGAGDDVSGGAGGVGSNENGTSAGVQCANGGGGGSATAGGAEGALCSGLNAGGSHGALSPGSALMGGNADASSSISEIGNGGAGGPGDTGNGGGGGGGGGYYGGGGGTLGYDDLSGGGGGGGSDYVISTASDVSELCGEGGQPSTVAGGNGGNGSITVSWQ